MHGDYPVAEISMCKKYCAQVQNRLVDACVQVWGGAGYLEETGIPRVPRRAPAAHRRRHRRDHERGHREAPRHLRRLDQGNTLIETYTDTTPTVAEFYPKVADAIQQIHTGRFLEPTVIVMHPRRWAWMLAAVDDQHRPLVVPNSAMNPVAIQGNVASQRVVGSLQGLPVITDPSNRNSCTGSGTNEDKVIVMRASDSYLWELVHPDACPARSRERNTHGAPPSIWVFGFHGRAATEEHPCARRFRMLFGADVLVRRNDVLIASSTCAVVQLLDFVHCTHHGEDRRGDS